VLCVLTDTSARFDATTTIRGRSSKRNGSRDHVGYIGHRARNGLDSPGRGLATVILIVGRLVTSRDRGNAK
jgi:hypothetical protein